MKINLINILLLSWLGLLDLPILAASPTVTTLAASGVTATNATLHGTVNPNGAVTTAFYEYGLTTNYGNIGAFTPLPAGNASLTMPGFVVSSVADAAGGTWTPSSAPDGGWTEIASSADGTRLAAVVGGGGIHTSTNGGLTWTQSSAPNANWRAIASSADGRRLTAVVAGGGGISISTNGGATWNPSSAPTTNWQSVASSADGARLVAVVYGGRVYTSTNGGGTWTSSSAPSTNWQSIASSADGTRLVAVVNGGGLYTSTNSGGTWTQSSAPVQPWNSVASSADGTRLAAVVFPGSLWISTNGGATWTVPSTPGARWHDIASSADGQKFWATTEGAGVGALFSSTDGGAEFSGRQLGLIGFSLTSSADGTRLAAVVNGGGIWTSIGAVSSLQPATVYHYRLVGLNSAGTTVGSDLTFTTTPGTPTVTTLAASSVSTTNATLNGTVNPNAGATTAYFRYGLTTNYGSFTATNSLAADTSVTALANLVSNLAPAATYHFQLVAINVTATNRGADLTFTTLPFPPTVTTLAASGVSTSSATLNGTVNPNQGATTAYFQYGLTANYGASGPIVALPATNATLTIPGLVISSITDPAQWTQSSAPEESWRSMASSSDGTRLAAVVHGGGIYLSTNSGLTWPQSTAPNDDWESIASSADGARLVAVVYGGGIYTSTNSGGTWTPSGAPNDDWESIASSADGARLVAVVYGGGIYTSTNSGGTWTPSGAPNVKWQSIASSADGTRLVAAVDDGGIYTSTNSGGSWTQTSAPNAGWYSIASSADGMRLAAVANGGGIHTSANGGLTWTQTSAPGGFWRSITSSADGSRLAALALYAGIFNSTDGGRTWTQTIASGAGWWCSASSADGLKLAAGTSFDSLGIWTSAGTVKNLQPGTVYHYRLVGINSGGLTLGSDLTFITVSGVPTVTTLAASSVTTTNGMLNGTVNPNNGATAAYFQYGLTTNYGSYSATNNLAATNTVLSVVKAIGNLAPGTTYHFRIVGSNSAGSAPGGDLTFTTSPLAPTVTTLSASNVTTTSARLNGTINPNGGATTAYFQYGLTTSYGSVSTTNILAATNATLSVSNTIGSLTPGSTYHFRLVALNSAGTNAGIDLTFTTTPGAPTVTTLAASSVTTTNAMLNGTVNPNSGATAAYFQYGLTANYGSYSATNSLPATNTALSVVKAIGNLAPGTTYHFRIVGSNSAGSAPGGDLTFTTGSSQPVDFNLTGSIQPPGGAFQLSFSNLSGLSFTALGTTNVGLPLSNWTVLGAPIEVPPGSGLYQFTDAQATNSPQRFYSVVSGHLSNVRWASRVLNYSSAYGSNPGEDWSATQALGQPDTYPNYGDLGTAWAPSSPDAPAEFLELGFDAPAPINSVSIYETDGPGAVTKVSVRHPNTGLWVQVWSGPAAPAPAVARIFTVTFPLTSFPVDAVRIDLDPSAVPDWNEIDAVSINW